MIQPILLVEDNDEDAEVLARTFKKADIDRPLTRIETAESALDHLRHLASHDRRALPSLILLDLNLPGADGREVLAKLKAHPSLCQIPVIVLTTSADPRDIEYCYATGASCYLQKPVDLAAFVETTRRLKAFWLETVLLPCSVD